MRAPEFITEYINYNTEKFLSRWGAENKPYEDKIGPQGENWVDWLEGYDPTQKKKYVNWLITRYLKNDIKRLEDIPARIAPALDLYDRLSRKKKLKPEHTDIGKITNLEDVIDLYKEQDTSSQKEASSEVEQKMYNDGDAKLVFDDSEYKVVVPVTHKASCYFGKNTRWCTTSAEDDSYHEEYSEEGPLYIVLHKPSGTRWQFHFELEQFMDEQDQDIELIPFFKSHKKIFGVFKKLGFVDYKDGGWKMGDRITYYNNKGELHRLDDQPAIIEADGTEYWYKNGKLHREDGPAIIFASGAKSWLKNGKYHRDDGPAAIGADGGEVWYKNDKLHREHGPAVIYADGTEEYHLNGKEVQPF